MARQALTKAAEKQEIGWKKVESADVLSPSDWEVEATEVFRRRAGKIRECRGSGARFRRSSVFILVFRRAASHH